MKQLLLAILTLGVFAAPTVKADEQTEAIKAPLWECALTFDAKGGGFQVLVGEFKLTGTGTINCIDLAGNKEALPVVVTMHSSPLALNVGVGHFHIAGLATGIGLESGPQGLLGDYLTADAEASFIVGAGAEVALHGGCEGVTINVGVSMLRGIGFDLGVNKFTISAANPSAN